MWDERLERHAEEMRARTRKSRTVRSHEYGHGLKVRCPHCRGKVHRNGVRSGGYSLLCYDCRRSFTVRFEWQTLERRVAEYPEDIREELFQSAALSVLETFTDPAVVPLPVREAMRNVRGRVEEVEIPARLF
jgi:hypothetical protein